jgi:rusticyanin
MPRNNAILITAAAALVIVAGTCGYVIATLTSYAHGRYTGPYGSAAAGYRPAGRASASPGPSSAGPSSAGPAGGAAAGGAQFSSMPLASSIARHAGTRLAGKAPQTVAAAAVRALSRQVPAGASVSRAANTITFTRATVSFTVVAIPPGGKDMTFGVAGLTNPAIIVPRDARVTVRFINADSDEAHGWLLTAGQPPFSFGQRATPAISGAYAGVLGDPTAAGDGASTVTFQAGPGGTYSYICPMPGHAQMGMHGTFIVR